MTTDRVRLLAPILDSGASRARSAPRREAVRRRDGQTQQVVDVLPKEAVHEQELGHIDDRATNIHLQMY